MLIRNKPFINIKLLVRNDLESFGDKLVNKIRQKRSIACIGLDPKFGTGGIPDLLLKQSGGNEEKAILEFCTRIIDNTFDLVPAYKPQIAYFEQYNALNALKQIIKYIKAKGCLVILDAKRNDIGSTSEAYASYIFEQMDADATTINAYFGSDGVLPFLKYCESGKGVFILVKTSNKSGSEFQDLFTSRDHKAVGSITELKITDTILVRNYIVMAELTNKWAQSLKSKGETGYSSVGAVVGATYPEQMISIRKILPNSFFLIPGYGAQGGTAKDIVGGLNSDGLGAIVNSSRNIDYAYSIEPYSKKYTADQFDLAAREATLDMNKELNEIMKKENKIPY
jgi:orotidine-5'-phosphate decarboxylase